MLNNLDNKTCCIVTIILFLVLSVLLFIKNKNNLNKKQEVREGFNTLVKTKKMPQVQWREPVAGERLAAKAYKV